VSATRPPQPTGSIGRVLIAAVLGGGAVLAVLAALGSPLTGRAHAGGDHVVTVRPGISGDRLEQVLSALEPGDTLRLAPGTYRTGMVLPNPATMAVRTRLHLGTPTRRITVRAADPARRPLLLGELKLWGASYWVLDGLRVQGVDRGRDALFMGGGRGWVVRNSEFSGARWTGAYSNVAIASDLYGSGAPKGFSFVGNCVHDAARTGRGTTDHNVYVSFAGERGSGGLISRNIIFNHPRGAGIKLGNGGVLGARGPWGVKVTYNTIARGGRQVLMHGDVGDNLVARNILATSTQHFAGLAKTTTTYFNHVEGRGNRFVSNYATGASMFSFGANVSVSRDNALRADPGFTAARCDGFRTTNPAAAHFGRYGR